MHWGATAEEAAGSLPYDDLVPNPTWNSTRAVEHQRLELGAKFPMSPFAKS
jgi:hypothetical protein